MRTQMGLIAGMLKESYQAETTPLPKENSRVSVSYSGLIVVIIAIVMIADDSFR